MPLNLTIQTLKDEAMVFARLESSHDEPALFGVTDGKAVGTYLEHKFQEYLIQKYTYVFGSSAKGIDNFKCIAVAASVWPCHPACRRHPRD